MSVPVATITSEGNALDPTVELLDVEVRRELNRVPEARLTLLDGSAAQREFSLSSGPFFAPGKKIRVSLRHEGRPGSKDTPVFEGLVVRHAVESGAEGATLKVEMKDASWVLTRARRSAVFRDLKDSDVLSQVIQGAKLKVGKVDACAVKHPELVQYNATDWDFLLLRADANGLVVSAHMGEVSVIAPKLAKPKRTLAHGLGEVSELSLELDASQQWAAVEGVGWDPAALAAAPPEAADAPSVKVGDLDAAKIAEALGGQRYTLTHPAPTEPGELKALASARLLRSRLSMLRGRAVLDGDAELAPGDTVEIEGVGKHFNGEALVSGVTHRVDQGGWQTELTLGLSPDGFARTPDIPEVPAGGMLPPVSGLRLATVAAFEADPLGELRVKVKLPALDDKAGVLWARLAQPDAGPKRGFAFRPELGDEVVLGFLEDDPRQPIVLGALHSKKSPPPKPAEAPADPNDLRALVSRSGIRIVFDDKTPSLTLETTADGDADGAYTQQIVIDQGAKSITIKDETGSVILLDSAGITLTSAKDITLDASKGNLILKGKAIDLQ